MAKKHTTHTPLPRNLVRKVCHKCKRSHDGKVSCNRYKAALEIVAKANYDQLKGAIQAMAYARASKAIESVDGEQVDKSPAGE